MPKSALCCNLKFKEMQKSLSVANYPRDVDHEEFVERIEPQVCLN